MTRAEQIAAETTKIQGLLSDLNTFLVNHNGTAKTDLTDAVGAVPDQSLRTREARFVGEYHKSWKLDFLRLTVRGLSYGYPVKDSNGDQVYIRKEYEYRTSDCRQDLIADNITNLQAKVVAAGDVEVGTICGVGTYDGTNWDVSEFYRYDPNDPNGPLVDLGAYGYASYWMDVAPMEAAELVYTPTLGKVLILNLTTSKQDEFRSGYEDWSWPDWSGNTRRILLCKNNSNNRVLTHVGNGTVSSNFHYDNFYFINFNENDGASAQGDQLLNNGTTAEKSYFLLFTNVSIDKVDGKVALGSFNLDTDCLFRTKGSGFGASWQTDTSFWISNTIYVLDRDQLSS